MAILLRPAMNIFFRCFLPFVSLRIGERLLCGDCAGGIHLDPDIKSFYSYFLAAGMPSTHLYRRPDENENDYAKTNVLHYCRIHHTSPFRYTRIFRLSILAIPAICVKGVSTGSNRRGKPHRRSLNGSGPSLAITPLETNRLTRPVDSR